MEPVVGIFRTHDEATRAAARLGALGIPADRVQLLLPEQGAARAERLPTDDAEQSGVGQAVGGVVGAAVGASAGLGLGAAVASLLIPGVGAVTAVGIAAAALLGAGGALGGAAAGGKLEEASRGGLPRDEVYLYEDALAHGRSIVFSIPKNDEEADAARRALIDAGAETLDAAREAWWIGLRDAERSHYEAAWGDFAAEEDAYRAGFVAALHPELRGRSFEAAGAEMRGRLGDAVDQEAFRRGYARGAERAAAREVAAEAPVR